MVARQLSKFGATSFLYYFSLRLKNSPSEKSKEVSREMNYVHFCKLAMISASLVLTFAVGSVMRAQYGSTSKSQAAGKESTATLTATLVDPEKKVHQKAATVSVKVTGIRLIDPAAVMEKPRAGQGHLHYQVDDGPIVATTTTKSMPLLIAQSHRPKKEEK
jgi:hypothetical protein